MKIGHSPEAVWLGEGYGPGAPIVLGERRSTLAQVGDWPNEPTRTSAGRQMTESATRPGRCAARLPGAKNRTVANSLALSVSGATLSVSRAISVCRRALPAVAVAALALASPGGAAAQTTFGADLSQEPNVTFGCEEQPFEPPEATHASSCTWTTVATDESQPSQALEPPEGNGTITQVSVRVGPHTGPMKVVIMRVLLEFVDIDTEDVHAEISCCGDVGESETFTPKANAVTTIPVNLPVEVQGGVTPGLKVDDVVGLSVLEAGVPIPAVDEKNLGILEQPTDYDEFPAMTLGGTQLAGDPRGYQLLMNAVWDQSSGGGGGGGTTGGGGTGGGKATPTPTPTPAPAPTPELVFPASTPLAQIKGDNAVVHLGCGAAAACDGTVRLQSAPVGQTSALARSAGKKQRKRGAGKKKKKPVTTYASGSFELAAGASQGVPVKLSSSGRQLAHKHNRRKVWVNVTLTNTTPATVSSHAITLRF